MKRLLLVVLGVLLCSCPDAKLKLKDLPKIDLSKLPLPKSADGKLLLIQASSSRIELDPTASDAITAVGACTDMVTYCVTDGTALDDCVSAATECATKTPWTEDACCPKDCKDAYSTARKSLQPIEAFEKAFFLDSDCFPGLRAALEGKS